MNLSTFSVPDVPTCEAVPHYRDNRLFLIEMTWDKQPLVCCLENFRIITIPCSNIQTQHFISA